MRAVLLLVTGCGGDLIAGAWELRDVGPAGSLSTSATDGGTGCLQIDDDLSGEISVAFAEGTTSVLAFTGTDRGEGAYDFTLDDGELLTCQLDHDALDCDLSTAPDPPYSRLAYTRGDCTVPTPTVTTPSPVEGNWSGTCDGSVDDVGVDGDSLMHLSGEGPNIDGDFKLSGLSPCSSSSDFLLEGAVAGATVHLEFVDRSTLPTYPCGAPEDFEPVALDLVLQEGELRGDLTVEGSAGIETLACSYQPF